MHIIHRARDYDVGMKQLLVNASAGCCNGRWEDNVISRLVFVAIICMIFRTKNISANTFITNRNLSKYR
jgi:hypothetical protein